MPLSAHARRALSVGLGGRTYGNDFAGVVNAGGGALKNATFRRMVRAIGSRRAAQSLRTAIESGSPLDDRQARHLALLVGDSGVAREIIEALA